MNLEPRLRFDLADTQHQVISRTEYTVRISLLAQTLEAYTEIQTLEAYTEIHHER